MKKFLGFRRSTRMGIALLSTVILAYVLLAWIELVSSSIVWALGIFFIVPLIQFFSTPLFTMMGWYTYYSPMVVSFGSSARLLDLHNGTSFDYLIEMRHVSPGREWKQKMLLHYLNALLKLIELIEQGQIEQSGTIRGSSYFLSERSAKRLGFSVSNTSLIEKLNIGLNYIDLLWSYSLSNGKLTFPNLKNISTAKIIAKDLVEQQQRILEYVRRIERNSATNPATN